MPRKPPSQATRILQRQQPIDPEELAAANRVIDNWQAKVWARPLQQRQDALVTLLAVLDD